MELTKVGDELPTSAHPRRSNLESRAGLALGPDLALRLLKRSIDFRHEKLAVFRLAIAVDIGAAVEPLHWDYCAQVVARSNSRGLAEILDGLARRRCGPASAKRVAHLQCVAKQCN